MTRGVEVDSASDSTSSDDGDTDEGAEESDTGPKLDVAQDSEGETGVTTGDAPDQPWLLHFTRPVDANDPWKILHIDVETGTQTELCSVVGTEGLEDVTSSTFTRDDRLMVSNRHALWEVFLPDCTAIKKADYPSSSSFINGISPDAGYGLLGTSGTYDELVALDPDTGEVSVIGDLAINVLSHGASWVEAEQRLYMVESLSDSLYVVDTLLGSADFHTEIDYNFNAVGFEHHPHTGKMYGCSSDGDIFEIHADGPTTVFSHVDWSCNNLAAPWANPTLPPVD